MKALFVEDDLSANIPKICNLFEPLLSKTSIKKLRDIEKDESGYGASPEEIKTIVETSGAIEVEYRFPNALSKIIDQQEYAIYIVDRNLSKNDYGFEEVRNIDPVFNEEHEIEFIQREGDYLFQKIIDKNADLLSRFYFLTANSQENDAIRGSKEMETHIQFGRLGIDNFIMKGDKEAESKLKLKIQNIDLFMIEYQNKIYIKTLRKYFPDKVADDFIKLIKEKDQNKRVRDNLAEIRVMYERILKEYAKKNLKFKKERTNNYGRLELGNGTSKWLLKNNFIDIVQQQFFISINKITSGTKLHVNQTEIEPTLDAVNSLVYALKDQIIWFNQIMEKNNQ
jgi:hypothetical protein